MKQLEDAEAKLAGAVSDLAAGNTKLLAALRCVGKLEEKLMQVCAECVWVVCRGCTNPFAAVRRGVCSRNGLNGWALIYGPCSSELSLSGELVGEPLGGGVR